MKKVIANIEKIRKKKGITQGELARKMGVGENGLNKILLGNVRLNYPILQKIADVLDESVIDIISYPVINRPISGKSNRRKTTKITLREVQKIYVDSEVCMWETLATIPARGLSLEEAFELYIESLQWSDGDRFFRQTEDDEPQELLTEK